MYNTMRPLPQQMAVLILMLGAPTIREMAQEVVSMDLVTTPLKILRVVGLLQLV